MMQSKNRVVVLAAVLLALAACGKKAPGGQVVATVDKEEITALELKSELGNFSSPDPKVRKQAEASALQSIINRKILAQAAKKQKIDRSPEYARLKQRAEETLMIRIMQDGILKQVPVPTREEAVQFVGAHPEFYADHRVYDVRQVRFPKPADASLLQKLKPAHSIDEITAILAASNVSYDLNTTKLDMLQLPPRVAEQLAKLPAGEVFVLPSGAFLIANQLGEGQVVPFTGEPAIKDAIQRVKLERSEDAVARQFQSVIARAKSKVQYAKAYQPVAAAPAAKAATAAPAPAAK